MVDDVQIFENSINNFDSESYGFVFQNLDDKFLKTGLSFDLFNINQYKYNISYLYIVEGSYDTDEPKILITYMNDEYYRSDNTNKINLKFNVDPKDFKLYVNDVYIDNMFQSGIYGQIYGNIFIQDCEFPDSALSLEMLCYRSDSNRFIGRYAVINGSYTIPNLDVEAEYDIVLVDRSKTLEQKILSFRKPTAY